VGTEILLGSIVNANAAFLSRELAKLGIAVYRHTSSGDNHERLTHAFSEGFKQADIVITTGGLGPTQDDITKEVAAKFFGLNLVMHEESQKRIFERFAGRALPESVNRNALVPETAKILPNEHGSAPGICLKRDGKVLIMLPGPPHEMEPMFIKYAASFLREIFHKEAGRVFVSRTLKIIGIGETAVESQLKDMIDGQTNPTIAPYAKVGEVHVRVTASAADEPAAFALIAPVAEEIYKRLSPRILTPRQSFALQNFATPLRKGVTPPSQMDNLIGGVIYGEDEASLAEIVIDLLKTCGYTLAVAESCTGGLIASTLVAVAGCSQILQEGFVTYSNESKISRLGVCENLLKKHGAVSEETALLMAEGAAKTSGATVGLSTTGVAGPDGGTEEKPAGTVYVGLHIAGQSTVAKFFTVGSRNEVRARSSILALDMLRRALTCITM